MTLYEANITAGHPEPSALDLLDELLNSRNVQIDAADYAEIQDILDDEVRRKREAEGVRRRVDTSEQKNRASATSREDQTIAKTIEGTIADSDGHELATMVQAGIVEWPNEAVMTAVGVIAPSHGKVDLLEDLTSNERTINDQAAIADEAAAVAQAHVPECTDGQRGETAPVDVRGTRNSKTINNSVASGVDDRSIRKAGRVCVENARNLPSPSPGKAKGKRKRTSLGSIANQAAYSDSHQAQFEQLLTYTMAKRMRYENVAQGEALKTAINEEQEAASDEAAVAVVVAPNLVTHDLRTNDDINAVAEGQIEATHTFDHTCPFPECSYVFDEVGETILGRHVIEAHREEFGDIVETGAKKKLVCKLTSKNSRHRSSGLSMGGKDPDFHKAVGRHILSYHTPWGCNAYACGGCPLKYSRVQDRHNCREAHVTAGTLDAAGMVALETRDKDIQAAALARNGLGKRKIARVTPEEDVVQT